MKKIFLLIFFGCSLLADAQPDGALAKNIKLDFAIPDHPAFSILDNNPDNILKPNNSKEIFSLIYSNFLSGRTPIIPKDLSAEFSPVQLAGLNKITLSDYTSSNCRRILYDAKLSIGTKTSDDGDTLENLALGLRFTWIDKSALINNKDFIQKAVVNLSADLTAAQAFKNDLIENNKIYKGRLITDDNMAAYKDMTEYVDSLYKATSVFSFKSFRQEYKNKYWNKFKFETAFAIKFSSADSLIKNSHYAKFQMYNTVAFPTGKSGQLLFGLNVSDERHDSLQNIIVDSITTRIDTIKYHVSLETVAVRQYLGSNAFKVFLEGSEKYGSDKVLKLSLNFGTEINLSDGLWALLNIGNNWSIDSSIENPEWTSKWFLNIDLRFHLPEKLKL